jgi:hypothetical protein
MGGEYDNYVPTPWDAVADRALTLKKMIDFFLSPMYRNTSKISYEKHDKGRKSFFWINNF